MTPEQEARKEIDRLSKDKSLEDIDNMPDPDVLALEQFSNIYEDLAED